MIWNSQAAHYADLTDDKRLALRAAMFDQRPLKSQKGLIGRCELEPGKRKAPLACLEAQRFRLLQKVNDLCVIQPDGEIRPLDTDERAKVSEALQHEAKLTFAAIRKLLGMKKSRTYGRNYAFNFEEGGEKHLIGNRTASKLADVLDEKWKEFGDERQRQLVDEMIAFESEEALARRLENGWGLEREIAVRLSDTILEQGYASHSRKALQRLLSRMEEGVPYASAKLELYGDLRVTGIELETLPARDNCDVLRALRNPAVERALSELRKVVNTLLGIYGKPSSIRVELARELKHARKRRLDQQEIIKRNEKAREDAHRKILDEMRHERYCTRDNILKVRLAEECQWICPYTGKSIGMEALVGDHPQFEIEHIVPFSRCLDNSYMNKTLCHHEANRLKGNRTPYAAFAGTSQWEDIVERVLRFRGPAARRKLDLFQAQQLPDAEDFAARQLNDTRYMSKLAADYLGLLFGGRIDALGSMRVRVSPGRVTSYLRQRWDLNSLLGHADAKDRADHRHHAIDALVVALTGAKEVQLLAHAAEEAEQRHDSRLFAKVDERPWDGFLDDVRAQVDTIVVSSRVNRKLNGPLHKETILSKPIEAKDKKGTKVAIHHVRKALVKMTKQEVAAIVDDRIRAAVQEKLAALGGDPKKAFADPNNHPYLRSRDGRLIPIHKARIRKTDHPMQVGAGTSRRYVNPGSNHHLEVIAVLNESGKTVRWEGEVVSRFEAVTRRRNNEPIIRRDHGPNRKFLFSLSPGEHVMMKVDGEDEQLFRVLSISDGDNEFTLHTDARPATIRRKGGGRTRGGPEKLRKASAHKVNVSPAGEIFPASD